MLTVLLVGFALGVHGENIGIGKMRMDARLWNPSFVVVCTVVGD